MPVLEITPAKRACNTLVKRFYDAVSTFKISLPTPIMSGVRTPTRQFSSCVLIECGDSLDSINATSSAIVKYVSQRAGIGINAGRIRALGSPIRGGEAFHTGCIPFYKHFQTAVKSCLQAACAAVRQRCSTRCGIWKVESLLVLKNNRGVEGNRVRHMDYGVQINKLMYTRRKVKISPCSARPTYRGCTTRSSPIRKSLNVCIPNMRKTTASGKQRVKAVELFSR
ncbi:hypothetical protein ACLK1Z_13065 [Escherichia coli]